jgi:hypothetical protein
MDNKVEVFVRAHCTSKEQKKGKSKKSKKRRKTDRLSRPTAKWPKRVLIFDCETRVDVTQRLTFGAYRWCDLNEGRYRSHEEGLFFDEKVKTGEKGVLRRYVGEIRNFPVNDSRAFVPQQKLKLLTRETFVKQLIYKALRKGYMIVGFNLPFDISRVAKSAHRADGGGWSFSFSHRRNPKTKKREPNPWKPRIVVQQLSGRASFIYLSCIYEEEEWKKQGRFLDLRTLGGALRDESFSLKTACKEFKSKRKPNYDPTGQVTFDEIDYCRGDVDATLGLLNAMKAEFDLHPTDLHPDKAYSTASLAKSYLEKMGIVRPEKKFHVSSTHLGIAMQAYYGGRAECRIRRMAMPVVHTDFTSQYPTVNALLGNWELLTAKEASFEECTDTITERLRHFSLDNLFEPETWRSLSFFALIKPQGDVLPVRTMYNGRTQNIGLNFLTSSKPIWYAGPDIVASMLVTGKIPKIVRAIRLRAQEPQSNLGPVNLRGEVPIDPNESDFFRKVVEQKGHYNEIDEGLSHFLKILGNSGSYGLFVEVNPTKLPKPANIKVFSGSIRRAPRDSEIEKGGAWYFPPLASLITAGGRLLLAMLERCVTDQGGSYVFCDTDSMCIVASREGDLVPCLGGDHSTRDGRSAVKALSITQVEALAKRFSSLNPYNHSLVPELLKIEKVNRVEGNPRKRYRRLFAYAVSSKRYALFEISQSKVSILKCSGHGLGYLLSPLKYERGDEGLETPRWVTRSWEWLLQNEFSLARKAPSWLDLPAMMRITMTTPNVMKTNRPQWLTAFNFFLLPIVSALGGYPGGFDKVNFRFVTPFEANPKKWKSITGINLRNGRKFRLSTNRGNDFKLVVADTYRIVLHQLLTKPEAKSLAPDGSPCTSETRGLLRRASVEVKEIVPVGKETDRTWDVGEDMSLVDFKVRRFGEKSRLVQAGSDLLKRAKAFSKRELIRRCGLSQKAIYAILDGKEVRKSTLDSFVRAVESATRTLSISRL